MDVAEARALLGLVPGAAWEEVRTAFRRSVLAVHPDVAGPSAGAGLRTARLVQAVALLRPPPTEPEPEPEPALAVDVTFGNDGLLIDATREEAFFLLLEAGDRLGEVTYADPTVGLLEVIVEFEEDPVCSLVVSLQGRAAGTEAFCTVEPLGTGPAPPVPAVVRLLADRLAGH